MERTILHCDMNSFYASVEIMQNPKLRGKAVAVCGSTETRHGIILAKSQLAKLAGVKTGMANWEARKRCPNLICVRPHYEDYLKYSKLAQFIYRQYTEQVEPYGMDEVFLDVTNSAPLYGSGENIADTLRNRMRTELGLTISVGVSFNKVFAKLGSDMKKPDAVTLLPREAMVERIWSLPVEELIYCGRSTTTKLKRYSIHTIGDLAQANSEFIHRLLGKNGGLLQEFAQGRDSSPVMNGDFVSPIKSIGHGITCIADLENEEEVWRVLLELAQDVGHRLRVHNLKAEGVQISVRNKELLTRQKQGKMMLPSRAPMDMAIKGRELFFQLLQEDHLFALPARALSIRAIGLFSADEPYEPSLFDDRNQNEREEKLFDAVDNLRCRFGKTIVRSAALLGDCKLPEYRDHGIIMPKGIG